MSTSDIFILIGLVINFLLIVYLFDEVGNQNKILDCHYRTLKNQEDSLLGTAEAIIKIIERLRKTESYIANKQKDNEKPSKHK